MEIVIVESGISNATSLHKTLSAAVPSANISTIVSGIKSSRSTEPKIIFLPGVGHFGAGMLKLRQNGIDEYLYDNLETGSFIIGICLGMQLFASCSEESTDTFGLDLIPGEVRKLHPQNERIPNVGWKEIFQEDSPSVSFQLDKTRDYYFTHSYFFNPLEPKSVLAWAQHGQHKFPAVVGLGKVIGFQFHVEKSGDAGLRLLRSVVEYVSDSVH